MTISEQPAGRTLARAVVADADATAELLARLAAAPDAAREEVRASFVDSREEKVVAQLDGVDVSLLRDVTRERLRIGALAAAGVSSIGEVIRLGPRGLERLPGIGPQTATHLLQAAEQVASAMRDSVRFRIDLTPEDPVATRLVQALYGLGEAQEACAQHAAVITQSAAAHAVLRRSARDLAHPWRRLLTWGARRRRAESAVRALAALTEQARRTGAVEDARRIVALETTPMHPIEAWEDFRLRSITYYALLDGVVPSRRDTAAGEGQLPADLLQRIEEQRLDTSLLTASLRGYQSFGARFALAQRRVLIGDEMGLGKTVQAIAVLAHRFAQGATHALVLCPASVLSGWSRELARHSELPVHRLGQGSYDRQRAGFADWREQGGVGVFSIDAVAGWLREIEMLDMLIVDEAHYVKNPGSWRSRAVADLSARVPDVLLLTGTPMENRLTEFRTLIGYLDADLAHRLDPAIAAAGADTFRTAVASVYLRRNASDVLEELPELVQVEEWEQLGRVDGAAYRSAVAAGAFMRMRRAAYAVEEPRDSAKAVRLRELVEEAAENGRKVLVFSYFLDVVEMAMRTLGDLAIGPLVGSVPAERRQQVVDEFTTAERPLALVSQIGVGGVGLNLQAASVVILCEPQLKPTAEAQAIARAHRMGQVETVQVHRLLIDDSVDEHLLQILDSKQRIFDLYARRSALAEDVADAIDVSEAELARRIVEAERTRLFVDPDVLSTEDAPVQDVSDAD